MNRRIALIALLAAGCLASGGCLRIATAPLRAERQEKIETMFDRLARVAPETMAALTNQRMAERLKPTPEQQPKVEAINLKYARQLHALAVSDASVRSKARDLRQQNSAKADELKAILTAEQFTRFEEMKEELREAVESAR